MDLCEVILFSYVYRYYVDEPRDWDGEPVYYSCDGIMQVRTHRRV